MRKVVVSEFLSLDGVITMRYEPARMRRIADMEKITSWDGATEFFREAAD